MRLPTRPTLLILLVFATLTGTAQRQTTKDRFDHCYAAINDVNRTLLRTAEEIARLRQERAQDYVMITMLTIRIDSLVHELQFRTMKGCVIRNKSPQTFHNGTHITPAHSDAPYTLW